MFLFSKSKEIFEWHLKRDNDFLLLHSVQFVTDNPFMGSYII